MGSQQFIQPSFASGEIAPSLYARVDLAKYHVAARLLRNFFVHAHGGASNRAGTQFIGRAGISAQPVELIPFTFSTTQAYILEFGHLYMRVIMNGGYVLEPPKAITNITQANPGVVTCAGHGFSNNHQVYFFEVNGMTEVNSTPARQYRVGSVTTDTFTLNDLDGYPIDTRAYGAYVNGGTVSRVYTLVTPYSGTDVGGIKWTQSADTLTLCHPSYPPADLTRSQHYAWTHTPITFAPSTPAPGTSSAVAGGVGTWNFSYCVTAVTDTPPSESVASPISSLALAAALNQTTGVANAISWAAVTGAVRYRIYKANPSVTAIPSGCMFGYIGSASGLSFSDINIAPDFTQTPPFAQNPFAGAGNYPSCVTYYQQRRVYGATLNNPQTVWMSQPGDFHNFNTCNPSRASDAITLTINSSQVNAIKQFVSVSKLLIMTSGGSWALDAGSSTTGLAPGTVTVTPQSYAGIADLPPIVCNFDVLYVQNKGSIVRDLAYNFYASIFTGTDMSVLSNHLFYGHLIKRWCFAEEPFKLIWAVREDGQVLLFTYLKEQDVYAWTHADFYGNSGRDAVLSVASIPENLPNGASEDSVYMVVQRTIPGVPGGPVKYIERVRTRNFMTNGAVDITKPWFVDCGLQYYGDPVTTVYGLDHLNGCTVSILADGNVMESQVVSGGSVSLEYAASRIIVGLPYTAQMQTLCLEPGEIQAKVQASRKMIPNVTLRVADTRGVSVGPTFDALTPLKERTGSVYMGAAIPLFTGDERVQIDSRYTQQDDICIQQDNPLPCTILGVIPEVEIGH